MRAEVVRKEPAIPVRDFDKETLRSLYETMVKIRHFEEKVEEFFFAGEIPGFVHLYIGEEAVAAGVMANLRKTDYIQSTHRGHGHTIAKGADLKPMMAEIFGKKSGYCKGKGGSMHIADFSIGMLGANGIVGGGFTLAAGAALAQKMQGTDGVSVVFFWGRSFKSRYIP
jgi:TPP-dependent pyruvate/acetoin dehydrogenase alpha subunit